VLAEAAAMTAPRPKMKSSLQQSRKPRDTNTFHDPDDSIHTVPIVRTLIGDRAGAVPSEAYQYDLVFECFANDAEFQKYWRVPKGGYARCDTEESISQKNSYIRVVMDLDKECKLYPTAYTPGFATVPREISEAELARANALSGSQQRIPGLPEGYSVALDVYILRDAEILLKHQRAFRGRVDAAYRWLDKIVNPHLAAEELQGGELALMEVPPRDNAIVQPAEALGTNLTAGPAMNKHWTWHSIHNDAGFTAWRGGAARVHDPGAISAASGYGSEQVEVYQGYEQPFGSPDDLPLSCLNACPRGLKADPRLDSDGKILQDFRKEIHMENALINAFGSHVGLPQRDTGTSWGKEEDRGAKAARDKAYQEETRALDSALDRLWARTVDVGR